MREKTGSIDFRKGVNIIDIDFEALRYKALDILEMNLSHPNEFRSHLAKVKRRELMENPGFLQGMFVRRYE